MDLQRSRVACVGVLAATVSFAVAIVIWLAGAMAFRAMENKIADVM